MKLPLGEKPVPHTHDLSYLTWCSFLYIISTYKTIKIKRLAPQELYSLQYFIMTRVLLTGGSGFIAAHILETLLDRRYSVVTTVRSSAKGQQILDSHKQYGREQLDFVVVEDIMKPGGTFYHLPATNG